MKKVLTSILVLAAATLIFTSVNQADDETFTISAFVPQSAGFNFVLERIRLINDDGDQAPPEPVSENNIDFGDLVLDTTNNVYRPAGFGFFYVLTVGNNGVGNLNLEFDYIPGANPNNDPENSMGQKSNIAFGENDGSGETPITPTGRSASKILLAEADGINHEYSDDAFARIYLGLNTGDNSDPDGAKLFTPADETGTYDASLEVTATAK